MDDERSPAPGAKGGTYGLAKTFWLLGVVTGTALIAFFVVAVQLTDSILIGLTGFLVVWAWQAVAGVAVWRAAARYEGSALWAVLARSAVVACAVCLGYGTALLVGII